MVQWPQTLQWFLKLEIVSLDDQFDLNLWGGGHAIIFLGSVFDHDPFFFFFLSSKWFANEIEVSLKWFCVSQRKILLSHVRLLCFPNAVAGEIIFLKLEQPCHSENGFSGPVARKMVLMGLSPWKMSKKDSIYYFFNTFFELLPSNRVWTCSFWSEKSRFFNIFSCSYQKFSSK